MAETAVHLRYARVAPRKARAVIDLIRGKSLSWAQAQMAVSSKHAARPVVNLLKAGAASAKDKKMVVDKLVIKKAVVNEGPRLKRVRAHFRGVARPYNKQMSHITIVLSDEPLVVKKDVKPMEEGEERGLPAGRAMPAERGKGKRRVPSRAER